MGVIKRVKGSLLVLGSACNLCDGSFGLKKFLDFLKKDVSGIFFHIFFNAKHCCCHESDIGILLLSGKNLIALVDFLFSNEKYLTIGMDKFFYHFQVVNAWIKFVRLDKLIDVFVFLDKRKFY